jgi:23S rRNA (guanine745-N1)-methyltransferase
MLICPVRGCGLPLLREPGRVVCEKKHSFDVAKSGYLNLLQPQERRSKTPGDTAAVVAARRRLHDRGITAPLLKAILEIAQPTGHVLDAGCGDGFYLGSMAGSIAGTHAHGIDISTASIEAAAKRYPAAEWVVANADRMIPYADRSFSLVLSITGRMNPAEFSRVLREDGTLLVAVSSPEDLMELRGESRDRVPRTVSDFSEHFELVKSFRATTSAELDEASVMDVLHSIYRPRNEVVPTTTQLTFSLDLLLFRHSHAIIKHGPAKGDL